MAIPEILEALMLAAFSVGWYWSISVMLCTRRAYGKSAAFVFCTIAGYMMGLASQIVDWQNGEAFSYLIVFYAWNCSMTVLDLLLVLYFTGKMLGPSTGTAQLDDLLPKCRHVRVAWSRHVDTFPIQTKDVHETGRTPNHAKPSLKGGE